MSGAGILSGDVVVVRVQPAPESGEIVVALVGYEATVKRLHITRRRVELRPENRKFRRIVPATGGCMILGKVIEVRRSIG